MEWASKEIVAISKKYAAEFNLEHALVAAIICAESSGQPFAVQYEPQFKEAYKTKQFAQKHGISEITEITLQKFSIGLMQTMGCVARERGFEDNLMKLTDPELSIKYGCKQLAHLQKKYSKVSDVICAYNWGHVPNTGVYPNAKYVKKVERLLSVLRGQL